MTDEELITAINAVLPEMRRRAHDVGCMSGLWDSILTFETLRDTGAVPYPGWTRGKTLRVVAEHFGVHE